MTIWTALNMTDIEYEYETVPLNNIHAKTRPISKTTTGWMLGTGWILFAFSQVLNFIFYKLHPSSHEMWTWGKAEELEEWTPQEETQTQDEGKS